MPAASRSLRPRISFCTTCANRAYQLKATFAPNAAIVAAHADVEWVILNFCSGDDLDSFLRQELPGVSRRIVYARQRTPRPWHLSVAKNIAHRVARGAFLVSLDCDNFIGDTTEQIKAYVNAGCRVFHNWSGTHHDGTCGRIGIERGLFDRLGGYDESFHPMGYQDRDLLQRASASDVPVLHAPCDPQLAIPNTKEESVKYCATEGRVWRDYNTMNLERSRANIASGRLRANVDVPWAALDVEIIRGGRG